METAGNNPPSVQLYFEDFHSIFDPANSVNDLSEFGEITIDSINIILLFPRVG
jgi:hypothetical protein